MHTVSNQSEKSLLDIFEKGLKFFDPFVPWKLWLKSLTLFSHAQFTRFVFGCFSPRSRSRHFSLLLSKLASRYIPWKQRFGLGKELFLSEQNGDCPTGFEKLAKTRSKTGEIEAQGKEKLIFALISPVSRVFYEKRTLIKKIRKM